MSITMYNCGFGDCFCIEDEYVKRPLYVDFGIHRRSLVGKKLTRYNEITEEMMDISKDKKKPCDFLLTHYHEDHYSGIRRKKKKIKFENVYIPDVWKEHTLFLIVLDIIFKRKRRRATNILDVLIAVANTGGKLYLVSRGSKIGTGLVALWPDINDLEKEAEKLIVDLDIYRFYEEYLSELNRITFSLIQRVNKLVNQERMEIQVLTDKEADVLSIDEIRSLVEYLDSKIQAPDNYKSKVEEFNNKISIVFQNEMQRCDEKKDCYDDMANCDNCIFRNNIRNLLFTGDVTNDVLTQLACVTGKLQMHEQYDIIKIPHHGTASYYFDFSPYITAGKTTCLISNEGFSKGYNIDNEYEKSLKEAHMVSSKNDCVIKWNTSTMTRKVIDPQIKEENL